MNNDINEKIVHAAPVPPFVTFVASAVPMVFDNSMSYYEALCALWKWLQDDVIDVINHNATVTEHYIELDEETRQLFIELKSYVDNYFDNLDVQEEINNKLDDMVEAGTLQEIITSYIQANVAWTFDTVAEMKTATNLVDGSYAQTLGFHSVNDGGGALYKITDTGTANEMDVIAIDDLRASLILGEHANVMQFGAYGDNTHDDSSVIQYVLTNFSDVYLPDKQYRTENTLNLSLSSQKIICDGSIRYQGNDSAIKFVSGIDSDMYFRDISSTGIGVLVDLTANCGRNKLTINYMDSQLESFKVTGSRSTSSWYIDGVRWRSATTYCVLFNVPSDLTNVYYNRFIFEKMALITGGNELGIQLINNGSTGCDIQVQFNQVNFEGINGIKTSGNVGFLHIDNCRLSEIANTDWLEIHGKIPNCIITTAGRVYTNRIHFYDITGGEQIYLNCRVQHGSYGYTSGRIVKTGSLIQYIPADNNNTHSGYTASQDDNTVGDEVNDTSIPYIAPARIRVTNSNASTTVTVPDFVYNNRTMILLRVETSTVTRVNYGARSITGLAGNKTYAIFNYGDFLNYVALS